MNPIDWIADFAMRQVSITMWQTALFSGAVFFFAISAAIGIRTKRKEMKIRTWFDGHPILKLDRPLIREELDLLQAMFASGYVVAADRPAILEALGYASGGVIKDRAQVIWDDGGGLFIPPRPIFGCHNCGARDREWCTDTLPALRLDTICGRTCARWRAAKSATTVIPITESSSTPPTSKDA